MNCVKLCGKYWPAGSLTHALLQTVRRVRSKVTIHFIIRLQMGCATGSTIQRSIEGRYVRWLNSMSMEVISIGRHYIAGKTGIEFRCRPIPLNSACSGSIRLHAVMLASAIGMSSVRYWTDRFQHWRLALFLL